MRRSLSRKRRSTARRDSVDLRTMPRLLVDDPTHNLPPVSPMSPTARRMLRAQLFSPSPGHDQAAECRASDAAESINTVSSDAQADRSSVDVQAAIMLLQELRKTANPTELAALQHALDPQARQVERPSTAPLSLERSLTRRRSLYKPGEATRIVQTKPLRPRHGSAEKAISNGDYESNSLKKPARPSLDRAVTPGEFDACYLGGHALGSLRVTNGIAPTPSPRPFQKLPASPTTMQLSTEGDYFSIPSLQTDDAEADSARSIETQDSIAIKEVKDLPDISTSISAPQPTGNTAKNPDAPLSTSPCSRSSVLVGHRRHAQERGRTTDLFFDETVSPHSVSSADCLPTHHTEARSVDVTWANIPTSGSLSAAPYSNNDQPLVISPSPSRGRSSARSPEHLIIKESRSRLGDSAYGSRASFETMEPRQAELVCTRPAVLVNVPSERSQSDQSVESLPIDVPSSSSVNGEHQSVSSHLTVVQQSNDTGPSSTVFTDSRAKSFDVGPRPLMPPSMQSSQSLPVTATSTLSASGPRKLQKRRPSPPRLPTDDLIIQGQDRLNSIKGLPSLPEDILHAHTTRIDLNPEMEHLERTHHSLAHKSSVESVVDASLTKSIPFRFPSPTPTVEILERDRRSFGRGRHPDVPSPDKEQTSFFSSLGRSRRKSGNNTKQEQYKDVQLTVSDLNDVVGALGASPYDCVSPARSRTSSAQREAGQKVVLHPHQISSSSSNSAEKRRGGGGAGGMSAEDATMFAMRRSRDRTSSAYKEQKSFEKGGSSGTVDAQRVRKVEEHALPLRLAMSIHGAERPPTALRPRQRPATVHAGEVSSYAPIERVIEIRTPSAPAMTSSAQDDKEQGATLWATVSSTWRRNKQSLHAKVDEPSNTTHHSTTQATPQPTTSSSSVPPASPHSDPMATITMQNHPQPLRQAYPPPRPNNNNITIPLLPYTHSVTPDRTTSSTTAPQLPPLTFDLDLGPSFDTSPLDDGHMISGDTTRRPSIMTREMSWMDDFYTSSPPKPKDGREPDTDTSALGRS